MMKNFVLIVLLFLSTWKLSAQSDSMLLIYEPLSYQSTYYIETSTVMFSSTLKAKSNKKTRFQAYLLNDSVWLKRCFAYCKKNMKTPRDYHSKWSLRALSKSYPQYPFTPYYCTDSLFQDFYQQVIEQAEPYFLYTVLMDGSIGSDQLQNVLEAPNYYLLNDTDLELKGAPYLQVSFCSKTDQSVSRKTVKKVNTKRALDFIKELEAHYKIKTHKRVAGHSSGYQYACDDFGITFQVTVHGMMIYNSLMKIQKTSIFHTLE